MFSCSKKSFGRKKNIVKIINLILDNYTEYRLSIKLKILEKYKRYYNLISMTLNVFKVPPEGSKWILPHIEDFSKMLS